jgi:hypothetical protein
MPTVEKAASEYTDYVKKRASVVGRREFSDSLFNSLILQSSVGRGLGNKPEGPVPPAGDEYGVLTGFDENNRLYYPSFPVSGDFTVELFFNTLNTSNYQAVWGLIITGIDNIEISIDSNNISFVRQPLESIPILEGVQANTWYHVAVSRQDRNWYTSVNGVTTERGSQTKDLSGAYLVIGDERQNGSDPFVSGSISNFRVSSTALYTADFTVPTLPLQSDTNTLLLLLAKSPSTVAVDSSSYKRVAEGTCGWLAGPIVYPPLSGEYGVISGFSDGNYLSVLTSGLGMSEDFTIECFAFIPDTESNLGIFVTGGVGIGVYTGFISQNNVSVSKTNYVNKWTHIAIVSVSGTQYVYVDGEQFGSYSRTIGFILYIGADGDFNFINGKISNFRVSDVARYTQNFTPELPLVSDANTTLLITDSLSSVTKVGDDVTIASELISYTPYQP